MVGSVVAAVVGAVVAAVVGAVVAAVVGAVVVSVGSEGVLQPHSSRQKANSKGRIRFIERLSFPMFLIIIANII